MRILNNLQLLCMAMVVGAAVASIIFTLSNGSYAIFWQFITIGWVFNYFRVARIVDNMDNY